MPRDLASIERLEPRDKSAPPLLPLEWAADIEPCLDANWLIDGILPRHGVGMIFGHSGTAKTFAAIDLGLRVALGWDWHGRTVEKGLVLYIAAEGQAGIKNRIVAFRRHHSVQVGVPFAVIPFAVDLQHPQGDLARLMETVRQAAKQCGEQPALIVVDTLSKTFGAGQENGDDMVGYVGNLGRLANEFQCCVLPIHHRPKDQESREPRGHSSLRAGIETLILIEAGSPKRATVIKQKDGPDGEQVYFDLVPIDLGEDRRGGTVTSCIVQPSNVEPAAPIDPKARAIGKLSAKNKLVWKLIGDAIATHGEPVPAVIPDDQINRLMVAKVVRLGQASDNICPALRTGSDMKPDSARRAFDRARIALQSRDLLGFWEDWLWLK